MGWTSWVTQLVKNLPTYRRPQFDSWVRKFPRRRYRLPTPVFLGLSGGSYGKESTCNAGDLGLYSQGYSLPSGHIWLWDLDHKEGRIPKTGWLQTVVLEKTLESPLGSKEIKSVNLKGNRPWIFTGRMMLKLQYFGHLMHTDNSLEKSLMLGKIEGRRRKGCQRIRWLNSIINAWT